MRLRLEKIKKDNEVMQVEYYCPSHMVFTLTYSCVSFKCTFTRTQEMSFNVGAIRIGMTIVNRQRAFIDIYE